MAPDRSRSGATAHRNQKTQTLYLPSASATGWKNVVPPDEQVPLALDVRPSAVLPA